jgi:hypothetical protein
MLFFSSLSEASAKWWLGTSEIALLVASLVLAIGIIGEWPDSERWKKSSWYKAAKAAVVVGVIGEMLGDAGIFETSGRLDSLRDAENNKLKIVADDARTRAGNAEKGAAEAKKQLEESETRNLKFRMDRGQLFWAYKAKPALQGKPTGRAEVLWLKSASDGEWLAERIANALRTPYDEPGKEGWKIERVAAVDELPKEARPTGVTVIGHRGGMFVFNRNPNAPKHEPETSLDIVGDALQQGLETDIIDIEFGNDPLLPDDFVRVVVGAKQ